MNRKKERKRKCEFESNARKKRKKRLESGKKDLEQVGLGCRFSRESNGKERERERKWREKNLNLIGFMQMQDLFQLQQEFVCLE